MRQQVGITLAVAALMLSATGARAQSDRGGSESGIHEHVAVTAASLTPTRESSGTTWVPASTPMYGWHRPWRGWDLRVSGSVAVQAALEPTDRHRTGGALTHQVTSANWGMFSARRPVAGGRVGVRTMASAEPWTVSDCGSLNLLVTGEVCGDETVHDRQAPHDVVMELSADYEHPLAHGWRWRLYAGLAGEPAIGVPGYPHRESARTNPTGPLTHHWLEPAHVAFGVVTAAVHDQRWKAELSTFNGRDPDDSRADVDLGQFDSVAGRVTLLPTERLALQVSAARMRTPFTDVSSTRPQPAALLTASAMYTRPFASGGVWATTVAGGVLRSTETVSGELREATTGGALIETSVSVSGPHVFFGRAELGGVAAHHLHAYEFAGAVFTVSKLELGYLRQLRRGHGLVPGVGGAAALNVVPAALAPRYGGRVTPGLALFISLQAGRHAM